LLTSVFSLAKPSENGKKGCSVIDLREHKGCRQVPDGGSVGAYLLVAGSTCLAAMFVRSRSNKNCLS
jgi:hypothetical protein